MPHETAESGKSPCHLIIYANPSAASFDRSIVDTYAAEVGRRRQHVVVRDLYQIGFDPVLKIEEHPRDAIRSKSSDVSNELEFLRKCDALIFVYPIWFGLPPAILVGYVDRVLGAGLGFRDILEEVGAPELKDKPLISFSTSGTSLARLNERGQVISLHYIFDLYLRQAFGMRVGDHVTIDRVLPTMTADYAREQLERVRATAELTCSMLKEGHSLVG